MNTILVMAEHRLGHITPGSLETMTAALELKQDRDLEIAVALLAREPATLTSRLSFTGIDEIILVAVPTDEFQTDIYEASISELIGARHPSLVLFPHSIDAWSYVPAIAARHRYGLATDVFALRYEDESLIATRAAYSEKMHVELEFPGKDTILVTLRGNIFKPVEKRGEPRVSTFTPDPVPARTEHLRFIEPETGGDIDISQAEYMLSIGRGVAEEDNVEQFSELAEAMGFTLGCSRPIADSGWLPKTRQVGQSGKTVSQCNIYLALGISGSVQHMAGMKHVPNIIAVNTDADASIFTIARYGVVADMFEFAEELEQHFTD